MPCFLFAAWEVLYAKNTQTAMARTVTTNAIDIIIIWLYCRLYCRKDEILRTKERCRPFFGTQYLIFSFSHDYSKLMALDNTSRILFSCYCFFLFFCHFHLKQNSRGCTFRIYKHACFDALKKYLAITNSSPVNTLFSSCFILRSSLFLRGEGAAKQIWSWPAFFDFLVWQNKTVSASTKNGYDVNSNRGCLFWSRPSSAMIPSIINSVFECANNCDNFSVHWYSLLLSSMSQTLSSFLIKTFA